jgi:hypothetical protein
MPEHVSIDKENGVILIDSSGHVEIKDLLESLETIVKLNKQLGLTRVVVDTSTLKKLPVLYQLHSFASEIASRTRGMKHAIVVSELSPEDIRFMETVALNRGARIQIFTSRDDALLWLNKM